MPLISLLKTLFGLLSLLILGAAIYLLWSWWDVRLVTVEVGFALVREPWRLWTGAALLAWSFLGRTPVLLLLARGDTKPTRARREAGTELDGACGARLHVERRGQATGLPLVLTHGWGLDSTIWDYATRDLGAAHPMVVWDLPGLGRSKTPSGTITLINFATSLRLVAETAGGGRVVLIGHSIGSMTIQTLARDHPEFVRDRVAGVVLINTTYTNPLRTMVFSPFLTALQKSVLEPVFHLMSWLQPLAWLGAWQGYLSGSAHMANRFGFGKYVTRSQLEHTTLLSTRNPPGVQARGNLAMLNWDATGAFAALDVPVLVLGGNKDIVTKAEASKAIADSSVQGALEIFSDVNHMGFLERAEEYHAAIEAFISTIPEPSLPVLLSDQEFHSTGGVTLPNAT